MEKKEPPDIGRSSDPGSIFFRLVVLLQVKAFCRLGECG